MNMYEVHKERVMELVGSTPNQRMRPTDLRRQLLQESGLSPFVVNEIIKDLVEEEDLVYAYRDPCSYVEIPCNGCTGGHKAARPMKVVIDSRGEPWLCDTEFSGTEEWLAESCSACGDLAFTRT